MKTHFYRTMVISIIFVMSFSMQVTAESVDTYEDLVNDNVAENLNEDNVILSKDTLNATLQEAQAIDSELETEELLSAFETAREVNTREDATHEEIRTVEVNLRQAIDNALVQDDEGNITKESLYALYEEALIILDEMDDQYADDNLESALNSAINIYNEADAGQEQINNAYDHLSQEMENIQARTNSDEVEQEVEVIDQLITIVTKGEYDREEAMKMVDRIRSIHTNLYQELINNGVVIKLVNFPITELEEFAYLKGEVPRGWEGTGQTWDDVPGAGGQTSVARIGYSGMGNGHGSHNLELHEIAHPIDGIVLNNISESEEFIAIHDEEQANFLTDDYFEYRSEYFADAFAFYFLNEESRNLLRVQAPKTYEFIKKLGSPEDIAIDNLKEVIRVADAYGSEFLTAELRKALEHAVAMSNNPNTTVEEIQEAEKLLREAIASIDDLPVIERSGLDQAIQEALAMDDGLIIGELAQALERATQLASDNNATQEEIDAAEADLRAAINDATQISENAVDKSQLNETINEANAIDDELKSTELIEAIEHAILISNDPNSTQAEVDETLELLRSAIAHTQAAIETDEGIKDNNDEDTTEEPAAAGSTDNGNGSKLPSTATNTFNYLLIGLLFILIGGTTIVGRRALTKQF